jgi:P4 family phage/plasmid primase-like protien
VCASAHSVCSQPQSALETALDLLARGFWPVAIYPPGATKPDGKLAKGKEPIGDAWGRERWDKKRLQAAFRKHPTAGVGPCLGPGRGPGGKWLIDLEGDGPQAAESLAILLGGEDVPTLGWSSTRGPHALFTADGERLLELLKAAGAVQGKGYDSGKFTLAALPGLEFRTGRYDRDGSVLQFQSNCPPTIGTDGKPREWNGVTELVELPDAAYATLEGIAEHIAKCEADRADQEANQGGWTRTADGFLRPVATAEARATSYLEKMEPGIQGNNGRGSALMFRAACAVRIGFDLDRETTFRLLRDVYGTRCQPPWTDEGEIWHKIDDAEKKETKPRGWLLSGKTSSGRGVAPPPSENGASHDDGDLRGAGDAELADKPRTDYGNAERMVARHGHNIRYCYPWSKWLHWDGRRWEIDANGAVHRAAKDTARKMFREASTIDDKEARKAHIGWGFTSESRSRIESMLAMAMSEEGIPISPDEMDSDPWLFNCLNGTVDLRTGKPRGHRRGDCITQLCPHDFDPSARCPHWDQTLNLFFAGDAELIDYWDRLTGYALVGVVRDHIMPIAYGKGCNGKSTILGTLLETFGPDYAMKCPPDMLMAKKNDSHPTERTDLFHKRLVVAIESEQGRRLNETMVKELTGGDRIRARRMREDNWEFKPTHTLMMATNSKPVIRGTDKGIWRRLKLVPFTVSVEGDRDDKEMPEKLRQELPGILARCVRGCLRWQEKGLDEPKAVKEATEGYRQEQDVLAVFLEEHTLQDASLRVRCNELYAKYKQEAESGTEYVMTLTAFGDAMRERGIETRRSDGKWYLGIALRK